MVIEMLYIKDLFFFIYLFFKYFFAHLYNAAMLDAAWTELINKKGSLYGSIRVS